MTIYNNDVYIMLDKMLDVRHILSFSLHLLNEFIKTCKIIYFSLFPIKDVLCLLKAGCQF